MAKAEIASLSANLLTRRASRKPMGRSTGIMNARERTGRILPTISLEENVLRWDTNISYAGAKWVPRGPEMRPLLTLRC
jgi:hypothetical protein